jgi:hypothetical protein
MAAAEAGRNPQVDAWLRAQAKDQRGTCSAARDMLSAALPQAREAIKWGFPTWVGRGNVVAIISYHEHVNLQFHKGSSLPDPSGVLEGSGKALRHIKIHHAKDLKTPAVKALVRAAWRIDQEGA